MKKNVLTSLTWIAALALLVQGLAACSTTNAPTAPSGDDQATIQKVNVVEDGDGDNTGGGTAGDDLGEDQGDYVGDGNGKTPSSPSGGGGTTEG